MAGRVTRTQTNTLPNKDDVVNRLFDRSVNGRLNLKHPTETDQRIDDIFGGQRVVRLRLGTPAEERAKDLFPVYPDQDISA